MLGTALGLIGFGTNIAGMFAADRQARMEEEHIQREIQRLRRRQAVDLERTSKVNERNQRLFEKELAIETSQRELSQIASGIIGKDTLYYEAVKERIMFSKLQNQWALDTIKYNYSSAIASLKQKADAVHTSRTTNILTGTAQAFYQLSGIYERNSTKIDQWLYGKQQQGAEEKKPALLPMPDRRLRGTF
jgi:hypothetical protein